MSTSFSNRSHPSSKSALSSSLTPGLFFGDWPPTEAVGLACLGVSDSSARAGTGTGSDDMLFREELEEANLQLVWLEERDWLRGTRSSNFTFRNFTSWQITEISPLQKEKDNYDFLDHTGVNNISKPFRSSASNKELQSKPLIKMG